MSPIKWEYSLDRSGGLIYSIGHYKKNPSKPINSKRLDCALSFSSRAQSNRVFTTNDITICLRGAQSGRKMLMFCDFQRGAVHCTLRLSRSSDDKCWKFGIPYVRHTWRSPKDPQAAHVSLSVFRLLSFLAGMDAAGYSAHWGSQALDAGQPPCPAGKLAGLLFFPIPLEIIPTATDLSRF